MASSSPVKIVFICGQGQSGSTVFTNMLGEQEGWWSVGELRRLYEALEVGLKCGCGELMSECPFWTRVRASVAEHAPFVPEERFVELQRRHVQIRPGPMLRMLTSRPDAPGRPSPPLVCAETIASAYRAAAAESGAKVLVDASKGPHDAYLVDKFTDLDLFVVHLVRDPRGGAFSWRRWRRTTAPAHRYQPTPRYPLLFYLARWMARNTIAELILRRRLGRRYVRIRYEDFAREPAETASRVCEHAGEPPQEIPGLARGIVDFGVHHTVGAVPARVQRGPTAIEPSLDWRSEMPVREKAFATLVTLPLLLRYGYRLRA